ncbi:protocadherin beta-15-like isoform X1 [Pristis pectinata]|uniref:protocadherin beta-15-like isoform X1 n=1 Tax=Pristis pectinata TaxID=685728 RepID=UPI00223D3E8E|nr:protocadherin beta-15-like isoform X1 [Pristis pectinata]
MFKTGICRILFKKIGEWRVALKYLQCFVQEMGYSKIHWLLKWSLFYFVLSSWVLVSGQIRYSIPEELQLGAFVGNIADDLDLDVKELAARSFRIVSKPRKQYLDVNLDNGILYVKEKIDREQLCGSNPACTLFLEAVIEDPLTVYHFQVEILDVNDNAPSFPQTQFRLEISEVVAQGARFALESAHDPDAGVNSVQTYQLNDNEYFTIDVQSRRGDGKLPVLVLQRLLDREKQRIHKLVLIAKDGGIPEKSGTAQIIVIVQDANDNAPVFQQSEYRTKLLENTPKGTLVIKLNATDLDDGPNGEIAYSFSSHASNRVREMFSVDSRTGEIRVKGNLDYEENYVFEVNVQATDKGSFATPAYCEVLVDVIDINDNAPEVTLTSIFSPVSEDALPGTVVALFNVNDQDSGDNGQVHCQILSGSAFKLDSSLTNYYRLLTEQRLDRETISNYDVTIVCSDSGTPPLTSKKSIRVEISDINDNAPRFTQSTYTAYVTENNAIGSSIFSVTAIDPDANQNSQLSYSILETWDQVLPVSAYVNINSETGVIYAQKSFDYEQLKNFQICVRAQDSGSVSLSGNVSVDVIVLDQNDNAPVIIQPLPEYGSTVMETVSRFAEPGYLVAKVSATDADSGQNARLTYQIFKATDSGLFTISSDSGDIWTIRGVLDKDLRKQRLVVVVKDNGEPALSATITIIISLEQSKSELLSEVDSLSEEAVLASDTNFYLVIALGLISVVFLAILVVLAIKVHRNRRGFDERNSCCFVARSRKTSRSLQIPPNYVEVFGGDPLSQSFRYDTCSTTHTIKGDFMFRNTCGSPAGKNNVSVYPIGKDEIPPVSNSVSCRNTDNSEVKQPNTDWRLSQTHRAELNSSQYLEEEGVQREIQCEVQREVQRDVQREVPRDVQCDVPRNVQRDLQRDVHCDVQHVAENDPGGPRKPMCARPPAIPAGRDGWTLPRTAPRMQLQMTLGTHVPGTLRSQYLFPREPCTPGARISNSNVEFSAFPIGSLHCPWAANQTRDHRGLTHPGSRRPELDTEACGEIPCSPSSLRLSTQRLHSRDHHHALRQVNN